ncbi:IS630 family transposase [Acidobacteria bacterium AH-259-L09]|nr:IS630 family transposase [Acidobacteria bacterium AH-259-L09]
MLSQRERLDLERLAKSRRTEVRLAERAKIILLAVEGASDSWISESVGVTSKTVRKWRRRYPERRRKQPEHSVEQWLSDAGRPGRPDRFEALFWVDVLAMATSEPSNYGLPITHWTARELSAQIVERGLTESIHFTTVSRFLAKCALQPHRTEQWMNRKADPEFDERASEVKDCLVSASSEPSGERVTVSFDEKTGMQAKERVAPDQPLQAGRPARLEFEYERHGTLVLFAMMEVGSGQIRGYTDTTRTNAVTAGVLGSHLQGLLSAGCKRIDVVLDQLNTHWSDDLVQRVAGLCNLPKPEPEEVKTGAQRRAWLNDPSKPIVFHFTPKHASWLNPIEIWFGVLVGKVLRRGSFSSTTDLEGKVQRFIDYYNQELAHPYRFRRWKKAA